MTPKVYGKDEDVLIGIPSDVRRFSLGGIFAYINDLRERYKKRGEWIEKALPLMEPHRLYLIRFIGELERRGWTGDGSYEDLKKELSEFDALIKEAKQ